MSESKTIDIPAEVVPQTQAVVVRPVLSGVNIESLLSKAVDAKSAVEVLERLAEMRREMKAEAAKEAYDHALAEFQAECPIINKGSVVNDKSGKPRYRYAALDSIVSGTKELLRKHGFSYTLTADVDDRWVTAILKAKHSAGHAEESRFKVPIDPNSYMNEAQKFASALTFAKRYAFCNGFGILTGDVDDDANATDPEHAAGRDRSPNLRVNAPRTNSGVSTPPPASKSASSEATAPRTAIKTPAPEVKPASATKFPTDATKTWAINEIIKAVGATGIQSVEEYMRAANILLPTEVLIDIDLRWVPSTRDQLKKLIACCHSFTEGDPAEVPYEAHIDPGTALKPAKATEKAEAPKASPATTAAAAKDPEYWRDVIIPIPPKGWTKAQYMQNPDTIGSLYEQRHEQTADAQAARQRLWGLCEHYEPKPWTKRNGEVVPPSQSDHDFRKALNDFKSHMEKHGEKL